jgi:UDP-3-O-[3-hydroxymyristoyl] N-acetylglucosamine deacetylase
MLLQRSIKNIVETSGVGLHAGGKVSLVIKPAPIDTGIVFVRSDMHGQDNSIKLSPSAVVNTRMATVISNGTANISTVEHILSACCGLGIDNLYIEVSAAEIPIMDGSAAPFVYLLQSAGLVSQQKSKKWLKIINSIKVSDGDKWAQISPYDGFMLDFTIDFNHPALNKTPKNLKFNLGVDSYIQHVSKARTFGFSHEIEALRNAGLARGGSIDNVIVMDEYRILNDDSMRYNDEFVRHKILDAIGDLYMAGMPILGSYKAFKSGHGLNNKLLVEIFERKAYEVIDCMPENKNIECWLNDAYATN